MRALGLLLLVAVLAGCGANGAPDSRVEPGLTITGEAKIGVKGRL